MAVKLFQPKSYEDFKKMAPPMATASKEDLLKYLRKISKTANMRILRLERAGEDTYALKQLYRRLEDIDAVTIGYRIKVDNNASLKDIKAEIKAVEYFLESKGSTKQGLKQAHENILKGIETYIDVSPEDAEKVYEGMVQIGKAKMDDVDPSDLYRIGRECVRKGKSFDDFVRLVELYIKKVDDELMPYLEMVWNQLHSF